MKRVRNSFAGDEENPNTNTNSARSTAAAAAAAAAAVGVGVGVGGKTKDVLGDLLSKLDDGMVNPNP